MSYLAEVLRVELEAALARIDALEARIARLEQDIAAKPKRNRTVGRIAKPMAQPSAFEAFWNAYPRKVARPTAGRAWVKSCCDGRPIAVMEGLEAWKASPQWRKDNGEYIPYPATWLNRRGWEDPPQAEVKREDTSWLYTAEEYENARKELKR